MTQTFYYGIDADNPWPDGAARLSGEVSVGQNAKPVGAENVNWVKEVANKRRDTEKFKVMGLPGQVIFAAVPDDDVEEEKRDNVMKRIAHADRNTKKAFKFIVKDKKNIDDLTEAELLEAVKSLTRIVKFMFKIP